VRLYPGSVEALRALRNEERFKGTKVAAASSTTEPEYARKCLSLLEVEPAAPSNNHTNGAPPASSMARPGFELPCVFL